MRQEPHGGGVLSESRVNELLQIVQAYSEEGATCADQDAGLTEPKLRFRLWSEPPLASEETWLEIRARANLRTVEEERALVAALRARAPELIERMRNFTMFPQDKEEAGVKLSRAVSLGSVSGTDVPGCTIAGLREFLEQPLSKKDRRKHTALYDIDLNDAWCATAVLPEKAVKFVLEWESSDISKLGVLDILEECSPCIPAYALRKDAELWQILEGQSLEGWEARLMAYVSSLGHLVECIRRAKALLHEFDEVERCRTLTPLEICGMASPCTGRTLPRIWFLTLSHQP